MWKSTIENITKDYSSITNVINHEAQRKRYGITNALRKIHTTTTFTVTVAPTKLYEAILEYAAALEDQVTAWQMATEGTYIAASQQTVVNNFSQPW